ncbi:MAG: bile acid:sodium symporter [Verrucomicrobiota bacterium]
MIGFVNRNGFLLGLAGAVLLAWWTPEFGARGGTLNSDRWVRVGIVVIFLAQGFGLSSESIRTGVSNWRLHVFTQAWISLGAPLLVLGGLALGGDALPADLRVALFFLAVLPTTVSSAVALIAQAEGDVAGGVFNTVLSNLAGVLIVPTAVVWYTAATGAGSGMELWPVFRYLLLVLLLPFVLGHLARVPFHRYINPVKAVSRPLTQGIICFMVYAAFATSFRDKAWEAVGLVFAVQALLAACALLAVQSLAVWASGRLLLRTREEQIAAFFCGSQKSLAVGVPYAAALFTLEGSAANPSAVLLPLLFYHPIQLFLGAALLRGRDRLFPANG